MEPGVLERLRLACIGAVAIAGCALLIAAVLWILGALHDVQWNEDVAVGVAAGALLYTSLATGFVAGRWWTVLAIWSIAVAVIAIQQLQ